MKPIKPLDINNFIKEDEAPVFDMHIPIEHVLPLSKSNYSNACNYAVQSLFNCASQPMYEPELKFNDSFYTGECLFANIEEMQMVAKSEKRTTSVVRGNVRNNYNCSGRTVCDGIIKSCIKISYADHSGKANLYKIKTIGADRQPYEFEANEQEMENGLMKTLARKGKLKFRGNRYYNCDEELVRNYILAIAEECDTMYPYFPCWKNGNYLYSEEEHMVETPFFQNIIKVECTNVTELETFQNVVEILNIFQNPAFRLFFLLLSAYSILQNRIPDGLKLSTPFAINICKDCGHFVESLLNIFTTKTGTCCSTSEDIKKLDMLQQNRKGTIVFYNNEAFKTRHYQAKAVNNLEYLVTNHDRETVGVVVNMDPIGYVVGAFNVLVRDEDIDATEHSKIIKMKTYLAKFLICFAEWISKRDINIDEVCECFYKDGKEKKCFMAIYTLLNEYNNAISEVALAEKLGFDDNEGVMAAINKLCEEKDKYRGGEWVLEKLGDIYRKLCSSGECKKVFLKTDTDIDFEDGNVTFIEKGELLCVREKDMNYLVQKYLPELTLENVKASLLEADALVHDKHQPYLKNIHIPHMNKTIRFIAIKKSMLKCVGEINL